MHGKTRHLFAFRRRASLPGYLAGELRLARQALSHEVRRGAQLLLQHVLPRDVLEVREAYVSGGLRGARTGTSKVNVFSVAVALNERNPGPPQTRCSDDAARVRAVPVEMHDDGTWGNGTVLQHTESFRGFYGEDRREHRIPRHTSCRKRAKKRASVGREQRLLCLFTYNPPRGRLWRLYVLSFVAGQYKQYYFLIITPLQHCDCYGNCAHIRNCAQDLETAWLVFL